MLRAAHYKADAVDLPSLNKSPPKHRPGGILDLALTAADKYALSLLPAALKGTALAGNDALATDARGAHPYAPNGVSSPFKAQRGGGNPMLHTMPLPSQASGALQQSADSRVANSWDASLKEILAALAPENRTLKPAKLRDHKYPNQNHGLPTKEVIPPPRRELDEALITLAGGTRRNKAMQSYTATIKGLSRQGRRPEVQNVDVQYDVVPGVKLAWTGPNNATYSTTGFGGSSKKYTSQLVGRVSPHYAGMPVQSAPPGGQESVHLPEIAANGSYRAGSYGLPSYQFYAHNPAPAIPLSHSTQPRKALPYVSSNAPSLAKPLAVQYHPVLKSSQLGQASSASQSPGPPSTAGLGARSTPQRPATDQGPSPPYSNALGEGAGPGTRPLQGPTPYRLPQTPPEVAAEVARLRHAQELDGVINGVRSDLQLASSPRNDGIKSKFLQMYEDPNRPLTRLNPKQLLADMLPPPPHQQQHRRHRPSGLSTDKRQSLGDGPTSPGDSSGIGHSPMYERRMRPLPSISQADTDGEPRAAEAALPVGGDEEAAGDETLRNIHLQPPEPPSSSAAGDEELAAPGVEGETADGGVPTPQSSEGTMRTQREDVEFMEPGLLDGAEAGEEQAADLVEGERDRQQVPAAEVGGVAPAYNLGEPSSSAQEADQPVAASTAGPEAAVAPQGLGQEGEVGSVVQATASLAASQEAVPAPSTGDEARSSDCGVLEPPAERSAAAEGLPDAAASEQQRPTDEAASAAGLPQAQADVEGPGPAATEAAKQRDTAPSSADDDRGGELGVKPPAEAAVAPDASAILDPSLADEAAASPVPPASAARTEVIGSKMAADGYTLPPGTTLDVAEASIILIQARMRGNQARRQVAALRKARAEAAAEQPPQVEQAKHADGYTLPPGVTLDVAEASIILIQARMRGNQARRQVAALRKARAEAAAEQPPQAEQLPQATQSRQAEQPLQVERGPQAEHASTEASFGKEPARYELPPGVTPEMATEAVVRIQSHARGLLARRHVAELRKGRDAGEAALATAVTAAAVRKVEGYALPPGVTPEMANAAATRVQAHMRGNLARRQVKRIRAARRDAADADAAAQPHDPPREGPAPASDAYIMSREAGEPSPSGAGLEEQPGAAALAGAAAAAGEEEAQELTIDALKAALADDDEDDLGGRTAAADAEGGVVATDTPVDMSDPAAVAAAAAAAAASKRVIRLGGESSYSGEAVADTTAAADQAAAEASMARLAANSARTSAMFQGAGAEMRYSDDEASALELMDNLDGLLQGDDEAAAAAAAVAAAAAPAEGELVSISPDGVSAPQALRASSSGGAANPMDVLEPGGVRVLAGKYEVQHVVGEGAYGMVMKCKVRGTEPVQWVAIKEFKIDDNDPDAEDVKRTSLREVAVLEALHHPHVVGFVDKFMVGDRLFIVMEFLPCNLLELLEAQPGGMDRDAVRLIMFQLCSAIAFIHSKGMVYRDIKPENLLVDEHGTVKLCDFGFARYLPSNANSHLTDYVATRWYRAPELLLGPPYRDSTGKHIQYMYGPQVDMWAVGCLMGELLDGEPLFAGDSDLDQLYRVQQILGPMAPSHQYLFYANPHNTGIVFNIKQPVTLAARYRGKVSDMELGFMMGLLEMDPDKRLTGEQCLQHPYLVDLAAAANTLPVPTPSTSTTTATEDVESSSGGQVTEAGQAPADMAWPQAESGPGGEGGEASESQAAPVPVSPSPLELGASRRGSEALGSRELEKAGSLTRARGSLTRGGRSLNRGTISPAMMQAKSGSPVPGSGPLRKGSVLQTDENGHVVIVEGVAEGDEEGDSAAGFAAVKSVSALPEMTAVVSEIEPAED